MTFKTPRPISMPMYGMEMALSLQESMGQRRESEAPSS